MNSQYQKLKVGRIRYTNAWPVFFQFPPATLEDQITVVTDVPAKLNRALIRGELDMASISSFVYAKQYDQLQLMPNLSVSSWGKVNSILLFHKRPLSDIAHGHIALTTTSDTSIHLLKIILEKFYEADPTYHYAEPNLEQMMAKADAALLIGDDAIRASWQQHGYEVTDVGELWHQWTGYGMTYAVWAVNEKVAHHRWSIVDALYEAFQESKRLGTNLPGKMLLNASREIGGTLSYWREYFSQLCYDFEVQQRQGLELYFKYAWELGFLPHLAPLKLWNNKSKLQVNE